MTFDFLVIAALGASTLIVGCGSLALLFAWLPTRRWITAQARLEELTVTPKTGKYVRMNPHVVARYTYLHDGRRYEASRISVFEVRPRLFGGYDPTSLRLLDEATILEEPVNIKLDPRHPERSILLDPPVKGHLVGGFLVAAASALILAFVIQSDASALSIAVGSGIAAILFLISLLFRDGVMVLMLLTAA